VVISSNSMTLGLVSAKKAASLRKTGLAVSVRLLGFLSSDFISFSLNEGRINRYKFVIKWAAGIDFKGVKNGRLRLGLSQKLRYLGEEAQLKYRLRHKKEKVPCH